MIDYISSFPLAKEDIPEQLMLLLTPISTKNPEEEVLVTSRIQVDHHGPNQEYTQMVMVSIPEDDVHSKISELGEFDSGVIASSIQTCRHKGDLKDWTPCISNCDYIVASWGGSSFYSYALAEKVWMSLGLSPRVIGNADQTIIYDDLSLPIMGIAKGEVANEYYWQQSRNVRWTMRNDYLRKYLWMRGHIGVRIFYYEKLIENSESLQKFMNGEKYHSQTLDGDWCTVDIQQHKGKFLLKVSATIVAVLPEKCEKKDIYTLVWNEEEGIISKNEIESIFNEREVYLKDTFLEKYEKNSLYDSVSFMQEKICWCSPSYRNQWAFMECRRVGRNFIIVPLRYLYKAVPSSEVLHAYQYKLSATEIVTYNLEEEHIVSKSHRLLKELIKLGENLSKLHNVLIPKAPIEPEQVIAYIAQEFKDEGISNYPKIIKLSQVAPLKMYEQDFLSRCKTLHEILSDIKTGYLKQILIECGCKKEKIKEFGSLKLLQVLVNILEVLNKNHESIDALKNAANFIDWEVRNSKLSSLFINNDLRQVDAHEKVGQAIEALERLGFDTQKINDGYGLALDFIIDRVIEVLEYINLNASDILDR